MACEGQLFRTPRSFLPSLISRHAISVWSCSEIHSSYASTILLYAGTRIRTLCLDGTKDVVPPTFPYRSLSETASTPTPKGAGCRFQNLEVDF